MSELNELFKSPEQGTFKGNKGKGSHIDILINPSSEEDDEAQNEEEQDGTQAKKPVGQVP